MAVASAPFNNELADVILRSSDNVDFNVWKAILIEVSPVFGDMITLGKSRGAATPQRVPAADSTTSPVVQLTESSTALEPFLRMCYPPPRPKFPDFDVLRSAIVVAHKYQAAGVLQALKDILIEEWAASAPLRVYAFAVQLQFTDVVAAAARHFLAAPSAGPYSEDFEYISAGAYHRLLTYRNQCSAAVDVMMKTNLEWLEGDEWGPIMQCMSNEKVCPTSEVYCTPEDIRGGFPRRWFWRHHNRMAALLKDRPSSTVLADPAIIDQGLVDASRCAECRGGAAALLRLFNEQLRKEVDWRIAEVPAPQVPSRVAPRESISWT